MRVSLGIPADDSLPSGHAPSYEELREEVLSLRTMVEKLTVEMAELRARLGNHSPVRCSVRRHHGQRPPMTRISELRR